MIIFQIIIFLLILLIGILCCIKTFKDGRINSPKGFTFDFSYFIVGIITIYTDFKMLAKGSHKINIVFTNFLTKMNINSVIVLLGLGLGIISVPLINKYKIHKLISLNLTLFTLLLLDFIILVVLVIF